MPEQVLQNAERSAENTSKDGADGAVDEARAAEGAFVSNVTGERRQSKNAKGSLKGGLKKKGPLVAIAALIIVFVGLIFVAQGSMPFAIVSRLIEEYNTAGITSVLRADNILDVQLSSTPGTTFALSNYQKKSFEENGILPLKIGNGTILAYRDTGNAWKVAYGTEQSDISVMEAQSRLKREYPDFDFSGGVSKISLADAMKDSKFKTPYTTASKTWRGGNAGAYDSLASLNEAIQGTTRSRFWYTKTNNISSELARSTKVLGYRNSIATTIWNNTTKRRTLNQYLRDTMASTKIGKKLGIKNSGNSFSHSSTAQNKWLTGAAIANGAAALGQVACTGLQMINKAINLVASIQNMQFMNLASGYLEAVQMTQVGDADGSAMNSYNEALVASDDSGRNAMSSLAMGALMSGGQIDENSDSIQSVNPEAAMANLRYDSGDLGGLLFSLTSGITDMANAITICNTAATGLSLLSTAITVAVSVVTGGMGAIVTLAISSIVGKVLAPLTDPIVSTMSQLIEKWIWSSFGSVIALNVATEWFGEALGNALVSGADLLINSNHRIGSGTPASKEEVALYRRSQERVIAEEAEYQRSIRSPFDTSSQHTFLGSIVYNLIPVATTTGVGSIIKNISSVMTNSITKLLPTASAVAETNLISGFGNCPALEAIGAACDKLGRPYIISDRNAINEISMQEAIRVTYEKKGITSMTPNENGGFTVIPNSNADRFQKYCGERVSNFGAADASIIEDITNAEHAEQWWRNIPLIGSIIGDVVDMAKGVFGNAEQSAWATGAYCVNSPENSCFWESEAKYYQTFFEDQRILENTGNISKSAGALALEKYHESHPLDQSFEGVLARYSGMTKDDVIATLDFIDGLTYIANYHPEERYAFGYEAEETDLQIEPSREILIATEPKYIIYNVLRNRSNAIL